MALWIVCVGSGNPSRSDLIFGGFNQHRAGPGPLHYNFKTKPEGAGVSIGTGTSCWAE